MSDEPKSTTPTDTEDRLVDLTAEVLELRRLAEETDRKSVV